MLVGEIIKLHAFNYPNKVALVEEDGTRLTWKEFNTRVNRLAHALHGLGLAKGDRVAIISRNSHQLAEFLFAVAKAGLVSVALNYRLTPFQLLAILQDCTPRAMLIQKEFTDAADSIYPKVASIEHVIGIDRGHSYPLDYESLLKQNLPEEPAIEVSENDLHTLLYTSGTSGEPKGVPQTHRRLMSGLWIEPFFRCRYHFDDIVLLGLPWSAAAGQFQIAAACLAAVTIVCHTFTAKSLAELVEREKVTVTYLGTTQYKIVRDYLDTCGRTYDLSSLRSIRVGARPMPSDQLKDMLDYFKIPYHQTHRCLGSTENIPILPVMLSGEDIARGLRPEATEKERRRVDSLGRPYLSMVRLIDEEGNDVPTGEMGEIIVKNEGVGSGYWNKPELTAEKFRDGWYYTGDLGSFDEDGYLYFHGRKDFLIKSGMLFVSPMEVENAILRHPAVAEVAVIGVPDEKWGEAVKALVTLKPGQQATEEEIRTHCREYLAGYQVPKSVDFLEDLPKDHQGKIAVKQLIKLYTERGGKA